MFDSSLSTYGQVDVTTGEGLDACFEAAGQALVAVINTAAASVPAWCEQHQDAARAINVPTQLLTALQRRGGSALLIHISTDQVYSGNDPAQGGWRETDEPAPINTYGKTKLEAEQAVKVDWEGSRSWAGSAPMAGRPGKNQGG